MDYEGRNILYCDKRRFDPMLFLKTEHDEIVLKQDPAIFIETRSLAFKVHVDPSAQGLFPL